MSEVATTNGSALAIRAEQQMFSREQVAALKKMNGWEEVPEAELSIFFHQAQRTGLDPFARQIYLIGRYSRKKNRTEYTIQTAIDGFRLIADRTGLYAGCDAPAFEEDGYGLYCTFTVYKIVAGVRCAFTAVAYYQEYADERSPMWQRMPRTMLSKVCEALALRKAFPADLSSIYAHEEMRQGPGGSGAIGGVRTEATEDVSSGAIEGEVVEEPGEETLHPREQDRLRELIQETGHSIERFQEKVGSIESLDSDTGLGWIKRLARKKDEQQESAGTAATKEQITELGTLAVETYEDGIAELERQAGKPLSEFSYAEAAAWIRDIYEGEEGEG